MRRCLGDYGVVTSVKGNIKIVAPFVPSRIDGFTYLYALVDPRDHLPRYIGKSIDPCKRVVAHFSCKNPGMESVSEWVEELKGLDLAPYCILSETPVLNEMAIEAEARWISFFSQLGVNLVNVQQRRQREEIEQILDEIEAEIAYSEIALRHNLTVSMIEKIAKGILYTDILNGRKLSRYGRGSVHRKGELNGRAKLNSDQVEEIRKLIAKRVPSKEIGRLFGVSTGMIQHIKKGRSWL